MKFGIVGVIAFIIDWGILNLLVGLFHMHNVLAATISFIISLIFRQKGKKIQIPWFIFWFVVAMLVNTYCNLPTQLTHGISVAARCGLSATLFLIGGGLSIEVIRKVGLKPLVLGIILWAVISVASLAVILLL